MIRTVSACCLLMLSAMSISPPAVQAISTINCHCFKDRSYDPARPAVADAYLLVTTQNSFFAHVFGIEQREIVMKKRKGIPAEDMWIAYWAAERSGVSADGLLDARQRKSPWRDILFPNPRLKSLGEPFLSALRANAPDTRLAQTVVDGLFARYRLLDRTALARLRQMGATDQELIMAATIAARSGKSAEQLFREVRGKRSSWGELLHGAKIDPGKIKEELAVMLKKSG